MENKKEKNQLNWLCIANARLCLFLNDYSKFSLLQMFLIDWNMEKNSAQN